MSISDHSITVGLIINPIAGMGGSVGLKGTDGRKILEEAIRRGLDSQASQRVRECFQEIQGLKTKLKILTLDGVMGGDLMKEMGFSVEIIIDSRLPNSTYLFETKSDFTRVAAQIMKSRQVALIVFLGGDGTARDLYEAIGMEIPVLGIPGGVKIHSSVFAINPIAAGQLILVFPLGRNRASRRRGSRYRRRGFSRQPSNYSPLWVLICSLYTFIFSTIKNGNTSNGR